MSKVNETELLYLMSLSQVPLVGDILVRNLISYCGSAENVFREKESRLAKIPGIGTLIAANIKEFSDFTHAINEIEWANKHHVQIITCFDDAFPYRLKNCADAPVVLFKKGQASLNAARIVAVVGTRNATDYGKEFTRNLTEQLSGSGAMVISGMAYGIDYAAHRASLDNGLITGAVFGHGLNLIYPAMHKNTAHEMLDSGGFWLSEVWSRNKCGPENFPKRNRIVAGMCDALVVVESDVTGGAMITADIAHSYNRDVFAVPGRVTDKYSSGCNALIRQNKAAMLDKPSELLRAMMWDAPAAAKKKKAIQQPILIELNEEEKRVLQILGKGEAGIDVLFTEADMSSAELAMVLLELEMKGAVKSLPGKRYGLN